MAILATWHTHCLLLNKNKDITKVVYALDITLLSVSMVSVLDGFSVIK